MDTIYATTVTTRTTTGDDYAAAELARAMEVRP